MKEKSQVGADIYIEDSPDNILQLRESGLYTICFINSTNRHISDPKASSWEEAYRLVKERSRDIGR
jgi:hypothetical protein